MKKSTKVKTAISNFNEAIDNDIAVIQGKITANVPVTYAGLRLSLQLARNKIAQLRLLKKH